MHSERTVAPPGAGSALDRWLTRAIQLTALLLVVAVVGLGLGWYALRYLHPSTSAVDWDTSTVEGQIRLQPNDLQLRVAVANLYLEQGRLDDAIAQAGQVLEASPENLGALITLGQAQARKGQPGPAIEYLSRALDLNRDNPMAKVSLQLALVHRSLGEIYLSQGQTGQAVDEYRQALEINRGDADALRSLGDALVAQGQLDEALESYRRALRLVPEFPEVYRSLERVYQARGDGAGMALAQGMARYSRGDLEGALADLQQAARTAPDMLEARLGLAMAYERKGRRAEALAEYRQAAALDATSIAARQGVGRMGEVQ